MKTLACTASLSKHVYTQTCKKSQIWSPLAGNVWNKCEHENDVGEKVAKLEAIFAVVYTLHTALL